MKDQECSNIIIEPLPEFEPIQFDFDFELDFKEFELNFKFDME